MNIFFLDWVPQTAARFHNDRHCVKMILESAQMLCTAHRIVDDAQDDILYKSTHKNHPSSKWARESASNYRWLYLLFVSLCDEYTYRYGKVHKTDTKLRDRLSIVPFGLREQEANSKWTFPPQCMPDQYKTDNTVDAYRSYYLNEKSHIANWTRRDVPSWWKAQQ